ncbi:hypothetical protein M8756_19815, partial [Lutimaribacter sp. EGI FJ00015]|nr:hypothetical protein [Lutimaribacter sp. EGI FJ00015]
AFVALDKYKKDGTMPEKLTRTKSTLYLPDTAKEEFFMRLQIWKAARREKQKMEKLQKKIARYIA